MCRKYPVPREVIDAHPPGQRSDRQKFISKRILLWLTEAKIDTAPMIPGKPWQNGADESLAKFRDECLNMESNRIEALDRNLAPVITMQYGRIVCSAPTEFRRHYESGILR